VNKKTKPAPRRYGKFLVIFWGLFFSGLLLFSTFVYGVSKGWFDPLPEIEELENPRSSLATEVISSDGVVIGKFYRENRSNVQFNELSPALVNALVATEDMRFYDHSGIDFKRTFTIIFHNLSGRKQGGSTISQQLAKNLFKRRDFDTFKKKVITKVKEWIIAVRIEERYTKEEIISMYYNTVEFGGNAFGIKSAAQTFFGKTPAEINTEEAAMLVGILKGITKFNPKSRPEAAEGRRNTVLGQMHKYNYIDKALYDSLRKQPIKLNYQEEDHNAGLATYFREYLRVELHDWARENDVNLYKDGLKIYTTIDSRMQTYAEQAVQKHLADLQPIFNAHWKGKVPWGEFTELLTEGMKRSDRYIRLKDDSVSEAEIEKIFNKPVKMKLFGYKAKNLVEIDTVLSPMDSIKYYKYFLQTGFMSMDPHSGHIKAWVGGINYKYFKYDHVNIRAKRQVGSTFKPFVYTLAVDNGWSPCYKAPNEPVVFEEYENWTPDNADYPNGGELTLYKGLSMSVNNIVAFLMKQLGPKGPQSVIELAKKMGITSKLEPYPSICLGASDASVFEMVGAFSTYANKGVWVEPVFLQKIEDKNGNVLLSNKQKTVEAMSEQTAYIMLRMLQGPVNSGTAYNVRGKHKLPYAIAGKTGTTSNQSDGWFIGITPDLVSGAWVGNEDRAVHFRTLQYGSGSGMALPIWGYYMEKVYADSTLKISKGDFESPKTPLTVEINCSNYIQPGGTKIDLSDQ
jgi:penicillin-binding protein 1A